MLALLDLPTMGMYMLLGRISDFNPTIRDAYDSKFFIVGLATWLVTGAVFGVLIAFFSTKGEAAATSGRST